MGRWLRVALLFIEGVSTAALGALAVFAPELVFAKITDAPLDAGGLAVARQLGAVWLTVGVVVCTLPYVQDRRALRLLLVPIIIGDVLHALALWPWNAFALTHVVPTAIYSLNRTSILLWPDSFMRAPTAARQPGGVAAK